MKIILYLSDYIMPLVMLYIVVFGLLMKRPVYDDFVRGAKEGAKTVAGILPTLVGLMVGVGVLRSSGFMDAAAGWLGQWTQKAGFPSQLLPVAVVKLFSSTRSALQFSLPETAPSRQRRAYNQQNCDTNRLRPF